MSPLESLATQCRKHWLTGDETFPEWIWEVPHIHHRLNGTRFYCCGIWCAIENYTYPDKQDECFFWGYDKGLEILYEDIRKNG